MKQLRILAFGVLAAASSFMHIGTVHADEADNALLWLLGQQSVQGSWGEQPASLGNEFQTTSEVLETLEILNPGAAYNAGITWLSGQPASSADYLSRQLFLLADAGQNVANLQISLSVLQSASGGWGLDDEFTSDMLDTSLALRALSRSSYGNMAVLQGGLNYLLNKRNLDGGAGRQTGNDSHPYYTAIYLLALYEYQQATGSLAADLTGAMNAACQWLSANQNPDGGWGAPAGSSVTETGLVAYSLILSGCSFNAQAASTYMTGTQAMDGSWNGDAFGTALAARALPFIARPNLLFGADGLTFTPELPIPNESVSMSVTVQNLGRIDAANVAVRFYEGDPDNGGVVIATETIPALLAGNSVTVSASDVWPDVGQRDITVRIDPDSLIAEVSEADNQLAKALFVVLPAPDLTLDSTDITFLPVLPNQGHSFTIQARIRNAGHLPADNFAVRFFDGDPTAGGVAIGSDQIITSLAAGANATVQVEHVIATNGAYPIFVQVDPVNVVSEAREDNNQALATVNVQPLPDLVVEPIDIEFIPSDPGQGKDFIIRTSVHNSGGLNASAFDVIVYAGDPAAGGIQIAGWNVSSLGAGGAISLETGHSELVSGPHDIYVVVDTANLLIEASESNNKAFATVNVTPLPDLLVAASDITSLPAFPRLNEVFTVRATIHNAGDAEALNLLVRIFNGDPAAGGQQISSDLLIGQLLAGASESVEVTYSSSVEGQYDFYVQVDPLDSLFEIDESNNSAFRAVWLSQTTPFQWAESFMIATDDNGRIYYASSNGDGTWSDYRHEWTVTGTVRGVTIADFDNDGDLDFMVPAHPGGNTLEINLFENDGTDNFVNLGPVATSAASSGGAYGMTSGDYNEDGYADFVISRNGRNLIIGLSNQLGGFDLNEIDTSFGNGRGIDTADFDADGHLDFVRADSSARILYYKGDGLGGFTRVGQIADSGSDAYGLVAADFNNDGKADFIANSSSSGSATFYAGNGDGTFQAGLGVPSIDFNNYGKYDGYDYNQDGNVDLITVSYSSRKIRFYPGNGDGSFGAAVVVNAVNTPGNILGVSAPPYRIFGTPYAVAKPDEQSIVLGGSASLNGSESRDGDNLGNIVDWNWDFADGQSAIGETVSHAYGVDEATAEGAYNVILRVTDNDGLIALDQAKVNVQGAPPVAEAGGPYTVGESAAQLGLYTVQLDASASTDSGGIVSYLWDFGDAWSDDFEDGDANGWSPAAGTWNVTAGSYQQTDINHNFAHALTGQTAAGDYTFSADVEMLAGTGQEAILLFRSLDANNRYEIRLRGRGLNDLLLIRVLNGTSTTLKDYNLPSAVALNTVYRLSVKAEAGTFSFYLNDSFAFSITDTSFDHGLVGLGTYRAHARFDNVILDSTVTGQTVNHRYNAGSYTATLTVTDKAGQQQSDTAVVTAQPGAAPVAVAGTDVTLGEVDAHNDSWLVLFDAGGSTDDSGIALYEWDFGDGTTAVGQNVQHIFTPDPANFPLVQYNVTLTVTDHALQTSTSQLLVTIDLSANAAPVANGGGDYAVGEEAANGGVWTVHFDGSGSSDAEGIRRYEWDFGDGGILTTWWPNERHNFMEAGTRLYGYDVPDARLRIIGTQQNTQVKIIDLTTGQVVKSNTLNKYGYWSNAEPGDGIYFKVEADKPVLAYLTDGASHSTFVPSLDNGPVGQEFIFQNINAQGFYVYAVEDALVQFFQTNGNLLAERYLTAGSYWAPSLANATIYHAKASGKVSMQNVGSSGYTTVPANNGDGAGQGFYFATQLGTTGAFAVFAHSDALVNVYDLDSGALVASQSVTAGNFWFQNGVGTHRLRLEATADVEVWAGDTEAGAGIVNLGDDISFAGGKDGKLFYLHGLADGAVVFAMHDGSLVNVDGTVHSLNADEYLTLSGGVPHRVESNLPVVIQTLGRANVFNDLGTYLGGMSQVTHGYNPDLTIDPQAVYNASLTVYDNANQNHRDDFLVTVSRTDVPVADHGGPYAIGEEAATGGNWLAQFDASGSTDDVGIYRYEWDFDSSDGIQVNATGIAPTHLYSAPGTYTVTLKVYDNALQVSEITTQIVVSFSNPPMADAGGPYVFGEEAASFGVWTATLDGTGSTDDSALFDYVWDFDVLLIDDFNDNALDGALWTSAGASESAGRLSVSGVSNWSTRGFYSTQSFERKAGLVFQGQVLDPGIGTRNMMWGVFKAAPASFHYNQMPHALYFNNGNLNIYEDGSHRGSVGSYQANVLYDVRIVVKASGADYFIRESGATGWTQLTGYSSLNRSSSPLRVGASVLRPVWEFDDQVKKNQLTGPIVTREYTQIGNDAVTLTVRDNALQPDSDSTTIEIQDGAAPVADAGGDYTVEMGSFLQFNGTASSDDVAIQTYDWLFGDSTGGASDLPFTGQGAAPRHFYQDVGTYTAQLTVSDNTLKSDSATAIVNVIVGNPPLASGQAVSQGAANGPPVYFNAENSMDDYGIVEYRWDFDASIDRDGDGDPTNDIDAVGARPFHTFANATTPATSILSDNFEDGVTTGWTTNGTVVETGGKLQVTGTGWGSGYVFTDQTLDRSALRFTVQVDTPASGNMMIGYKNNSTSGHYNQLHHAIYFANGTLYIYEDGSQRGRVGNYTRGTSYEVRIDLKNAGADYYIRQSGATVWTQLTSYSSLNRTGTPLRIGMDAHSGTWGLDNVVVQGTGPKLVTLTVEDGAGQTSSTQFPVEVAPNLPPNVIAVPWVAHDLLVPHETYNGKAIRLKGIVRDADAQTFQWDFGDGTQSAVLNVSNKFDLSVSHTYPDAPNGTPFVATLTVWDSLNQMGQDSYNLVVKPKTLSTETNIAIDEGLWYLHQQQTRTTAEGYDIGYWTSNARASATASSTQAFLINTHLETVDPAEDPYQETVMRGLRQLFRYLGTVNIATQTYGEPDTDGNNIGIQTGVNGSGSQPIYQGGQVMDAIASTGTPLARAITGSAGIKRRSYFDILTDMTDQYGWGQTEQGQGGGWRYSWNSSIDNSAAQWGAIGMLAAEDIFGIPVPQWVKDRNLVWLDRAYSGIGWGYTTGGTTIAGTPSGLVQMVFDDQTTQDPRWQTAEKWIADVWNSQYIVNPGNRPYYQYYAATKAMRLAKPEPVVKFASNGFDWFSDPVTGLARTLIDDQQASGVFPGSSLISGQLRSAWGVIMLSRTLFVQPPVADAGRDRVWAVDLPLAFDGSNSFHLDPFRSLVKYEWDFDGDGNFDSSSTQPTATHTYPLSQYPESSLPRTINATLRVTDNNVPPLQDTDTISIIIAIPPHPPIAEAGGPYTCTLGLACALDGSGSFDIDPTDFIARYEWELDGLFPFDFDEATGVQPAPVFDTLGTHNIGLRVWDNGVLNDLNGDGLLDENERLSDQHFTLVTVVENLAPVAEANGPYTINEGASALLDGTGSNDPNGDPLQYAWDLDNDGLFDDATGQSPSFAGLDDGIYPVHLMVSDGLLSDTASSTVTVNNVAPLVEAGPDQTLSEGDPANFSGSFFDPGSLDTHSIVWDFGDGTSSSGNVITSHDYADNGVYTVTLTVTDDDGGVGSDSLIVIVGNAAPVVEAGVNQGTTVGTPINLDPASFTDAGVEDTHTASIDWGDGTVEPGAVTQSAGSGTVGGSHGYSGDGTYTVTVTVTDDEGASGSDTLTVTVQTTVAQTIFDLAARPKSGKISLTWTPVAGADSYNVYRGTAAGGPYSLIAAGHLTDYCTYLDEGLTNGVTYYYLVTSVSGSVESLYSNEANATPTARAR